MSGEGATTNAASAGPVVEPIVVNSGESAVTFDDLERIETQTRAAKKAEKAKENELADKVAEKTAKTLGGDDGKDKKDAKPGKDEKQAEKDEGKEKDGKKAGEKKDEPKVGKPKIKGKLGDSELDFDGDTLFTVKINGQDEIISLKDLQSQYSGRVAYDKKFQEFDRVRKTFESKANSLNEKISSIFNEKDPELRLYKMAEMSGVDPVEARNKFLNENMELLEKWYGMSEDERKADALAYENRILKHKQESHSKAQADRQAEEALSAKIAKLEKTHSFTSQDFWSKYDEIVELKEAGKIPAGQKVTPEYVSEIIQKERIFEKVTGALQDKIPQEQLFKLIDNAYGLGMSADEALEVADELFGAKAKTSRVETKADEVEEIRTGKKPEAKVKKNDASDLWSFDQI